MLQAALQGVAKGGFGKSAWLLVKHPNFRPYLDCGVDVDNVNDDDFAEDEQHLFDIA